MPYSEMIEQRLQFLEINEAVIGELRKARQILEPELDRILDKFYARISDEPELKALFQDDASMARARQAQKEHWLDSLLAGHFTDEHFERAELVGRAHARVGLTPSWYIGGYSNMLAQFIPPILAEASKENSDVSPIIEALCKAVMLDLDLVIHCYLEAKDRVILDILLNSTRFIDELAETNDELRSKLARFQELTSELLQDAAENGGQARPLSELAIHADALKEMIHQLDERIDKLKNGQRLYLKRGSKHTGTFSQLVTQVISE